MSGVTASLPSFVELAQAVDKKDKIAKLQAAIAEGEAAGRATGC
jgi:hypothetical protein